MDRRGNQLQSPGRVTLWRGGVAESVHRVHGVAVAPDGARLGAFGDAERPTMLRSAAKPFQALPMVEDGAVDALGVEPRELALACGSHGGEPVHVSLARSLLARAGASESELACGAHPPMHGPSARALTEAGGVPGRIHNNCSGKHAGMLLLARHRGWPTAGYHEDGHPVQQRMQAEVARWTGVEAAALGRGVDGCGVVCFASPLRSLGRAYAAFGAAAEAGGAEAGPARVAEAMTRYPEAVAGTGRLCTLLMEATGGKVLAKVGAEGVYGAVVHTASGPVGLALKVEDGGRRAAEAALLAMLQTVAPSVIPSMIPSAIPVPREGGGAEGGAAADALAPWLSGVVPNTRGEAAARLETELPAGWWG